MHARDVRCSRVEQNVVVKKADDRTVKFAQALVSLACRSFDFGRKPDDLGGQPVYRQLDAQAASSLIFGSIYDNIRFGWVD